MFIDSYQWHPVAIRRIVPVAQDIVAVRLEKPSTYRFHPGQYAVVRANDVVRQYSFSNSPTDNYLELLIQREPEGTSSGWFHDHAQPLTMIKISQAFGNFTPPPKPTPLVCIAGRVGVAPFISMLRSRVKLHLVYCVRELDEVCYPNLLKNASTTVLTSSLGERITQERLRLVLQPQAQYYLCGSKQFVDAVFGELQKLNISPNTVRRELFTLE